MAQAFDERFSSEERGTGNGEREEPPAEVAVRSSPKAVSAAAEYFRPDSGRDEARPSQLPTVVPRASLKYEVPFEDATGLPPPM